MKHTLIGGLLFLLSNAASAGFLSFSGQFSSDDDRYYANFTVEQDSEVFFTSYGYAGGVNASGEVVLDGGFDPYLTVFSSSGGYIWEEDDGRGVVSASSGLDYDTYMVLDLMAGDYVAVLTQADNFYLFGDYLADSSWFGSGTLGFVDSEGFQRSNNFSFDIEGVGINPVPLPASVWLFLSAISSLLIANRRKKIA